MKNRIGKFNRRAEIISPVYQSVMQKQAGRSVPKREKKFHLGNYRVDTFCDVVAFELL